MFKNRHRLIPVEHWEYKLNDLLYGMLAVSGCIKNEHLIGISSVGECLPARSGRAALVLALKALDLPQSARIGVPLYCCEVVFQAIETAGYTTCFIDIESEDFCISPDDLSDKISRIDALIAVHMFGNPCDMKRLKKIANGKPIIEDCAQALGSLIDGRIAGSFGEISFFSFRSGKYLSAGEGGAVFSGDDKKFSKMARLMEELPAPGLKDEYLHIFKIYLKSILRSKPFYGLIGYLLWHVYNRKRNSSQKTYIQQSRIHTADLAIALRRIRQINLMVKKQRENAEYYTRNLTLDNNMLCAEKAGTFYNRYLYPIAFPSESLRDAAADYLFDKNIDVIRPYKNCAEVAAANYGYKGGCPKTENISKRVLAIPCHYNLRIWEIKRIVKYMNEGWAEIQDK